MEVDGDVVHDGYEQPYVAPFDAEKRIAQLVTLRDRIRELEAEHKEQLRPYKELKEKLEYIILGHLQKVNATKMSATAGTVSILHKKSASLADPAAFMEFVISGERFDMLDRKANVKAVEDYMLETGEAPPGVKFSDRLVLGTLKKGDVPND